MQRQRDADWAVSPDNPGIEVRNDPFALRRLPTLAPIERHQRAQAQVLNNNVLADHHRDFNLGADMAEVEATLVMHGRALDVLMQDVHQLRGDVNELRGQVNDLPGEVNGLRQEMGQELTAMRMGPRRWGRSNGIERHRESLLFQPAIDHRLLKIRAFYLSQVFQEFAGLHNAV
jgi:hypothetical protein